MKIQNKRGLLTMAIGVGFGILSCALPTKHESEGDNPWGTPIEVRCPDEKTVKIFEAGDIICAAERLDHPNGIKLKIGYVVVNAESEDPYEQGYPVLQKLSGGRVQQTIHLRGEDEPAWHKTPFVRIRKDAYFADIDGDGFDEFAIFPFSPGSNTYGTVTIYSLKGKIAPWGKGKIAIEDNGHVLLGCPQCTKLNPKACKRCY